MIFELESPRNACSAEAALAYEVVIRGARSVGIAVEFSSQSFKGPSAKDGLEPFRVKLVLGDFEATALAVALLEMAAEPLIESQDWPEQVLRFGLAGDGPGAPPTELPRGYVSAVVAATQAVRTVLEASNHADT